MRYPSIRFPRRTAGWLCALGVWAVLAASPALACFGTRLKVGVAADPAQALAAYATGYWVEEKTGVAPEFVPLDGDPLRALLAGDVDLFLTTAGTDPAEAEIRQAGDVPGLGQAHFWIRKDVLDDLRFFTVSRALERMPELFGSDHYTAAVGSPSPKKAARQAVHRAQ